MYCHAQSVGCGGTAEALLTKTLALADTLHTSVCRSTDLEHAEKLVDELQKQKQDLKQQLEVAKRQADDSLREQASQLCNSVPLSARKLLTLRL